jgi:hypothetical protein
MDTSAGMRKRLVEAAASSRETMPGRIAGPHRRKFDFRGPHVSVLVLAPPFKAELDCLDRVRHVDWEMYFFMGPHNTQVGVARFHLGGVLPFCPLLFMGPWSQCGFHCSLVFVSPQSFDKPS